MRTVIAGSRSFQQYHFLQGGMMLVPWQITEVVSGTCRGVDQMGERWAREHCIPIKRFPADWKRFGRSAGYRRNEEMAMYCQAVVAFWDETSRGTANMIDLAKRCARELVVIGSRDGKPVLLEQREGLRLDLLFPE